MANVAPITLIYALLFVCAIVLVVVYRALLKGNTNKMGYIVLMAIVIVNLGYFLLSCSKSIKMAVFANRLSYVGSVILLQGMYLIVNRFCNVKRNKIVNLIILTVSFLAMLLSLTGGSSIKWYYQNVDISIISNATHLVKNYGPLHILYSCYVFGMFIIMLVTVVSSIIKKRVISSINPAILLLLVTENIAVWYIEKILAIEIELLSFSYIATGGIFILLFKSENDHALLNNIDSNKTNRTDDEIVAIWKEQYKLTNREIDIIRYLIKNTARSEIAEKLCISENTVKKHTTHIYEKLDITSRNDLLHKLNEELIR